MSIQFFKVTNDDLPSIKEIYTYYVDNSTATFHIGNISNNTMSEILFHADPLYESFAIKENNHLIGYVLLAPYSSRQAYGITSEVTIYLSPNVTGKGIGHTALNFIIERAKEKKIKTLLSVICGENTASIRLFESFNFEKCGHLKNVAQKFGRLLDIVIYEKQL